MRTIPITQFMRPNGKQVQAFVNKPNAIANIAEKVIGAGGRFTAEVLMDGMVSLACEYGDNDIAIELANNDKSVEDALNKLIINSWKEINEDI